MVRYEDPPGAVKHVRFGKTSEAILEALKAYPGVKAIVLHTHGKKGEHPHYHIWWEGETPITNQTLRNRLKATSPVFEKFSGQNDWSFRNHDSWDAWASYVVSNLSHKVLQPYKDLDDKSKASKVLDLVITPGATPATLKVQAPVRTMKLPMREKFIQYLKNERKWVPNEQFSVHSEQSLAEFQNECIDAATEFWEMAFTIPEGSRMVRHALWVFSSDEIRKSWLEKNRDSIKKSLW